MGDFLQTLLRLKAQLGVEKDQHVATLLGISKTAFAERKKRGAFPVSEVVALAIVRADLDLNFIFTGHRYGESNDLTVDQVKANFLHLGITFTRWAEENGYTRNEVYRVLNGQSKANYGKAHEIAVKLGLKPGTTGGSL